MSTFAIIAVLVALGCHENPLSPEPDAGLYPLALVDGRPLPVAHPMPGGCTATFSRGDLLIGGQTFFLKLYVQVACPDSAPQGFSWLSGGGNYTMDGGLLQMPMGLGVPFLCVGEATGNGVTVRFDGLPQQEWADPRFLFGPWQPIPPLVAGPARRPSGALSATHSPAEVV